MNTPIPQEMQAVLLETSGGASTVGRIPVPERGPGQVLLRMAAAPVNPSDLGFLKGSYGFHKPFPIVPGLEDSGTVIRAGPGLLPRLYVGKRVARATAQAAGETWAEYMVTSATTCFPLARELSLLQGATLPSDLDRAVRVLLGSTRPRRQRSRRG